MGLLLWSEAAKTLPASQRACHLGSMAAKSYFKLITLSLYIVQATPGKSYMRWLLYRISGRNARGWLYFSKFLLGSRWSSGGRMISASTGATFVIENQPFGAGAHNVRPCRCINTKHSAYGLLSSRMDGGGGKRGPSLSYGQRPAGQWPATDRASGQTQKTGAPTKAFSQNKSGYRRRANKNPAFRGFSRGTAPLRVLLVLFPRGKRTPPSPRRGNRQESADHTARAFDHSPDRIPVISTGFPSLHSRSRP